MKHIKKANSALDFSLVEIGMKGYNVNDPTEIGTIIAKYKAIDLYNNLEEFKKIMLDSAYKWTKEDYQVLKQNADLNLVLIKPITHIGPHFLAYYDDLEFIVPYSEYLKKYSDKLYKLNSKTGIFD